MALSYISRLLYASSGPEEFKEADEKMCLVLFSVVTGQAEQQSVFVDLSDSLVFACYRNWPVMLMHKGHNH